MSKTLTRAVGTCLIAGAFVCGWHAWHAAMAARAGRAELARIAAESRKATAELTALEQRRRGAESDARLLRRALESVNKSKAVSHDANSTLKSPPRLSLNILDLIRDNPKAELLYIESQRAEVTIRYGPLFTQLGLSRQEIDRFQDNLIRRDIQHMDLRAVQQRAGEQADDGALTKLNAAADSDYTAAQRELLGDARFAALQEFERTAWYRRMVSAIAGVAAIEGVPFAPDQAARLVQALADASASYRAGGAVNTRDTDWAAAGASAQTILSPAQLEVFRTMDPGPSTGGLLQNRMYSAVEQAKLKEIQLGISHAGK